MFPGWNLSLQLLQVEFKAKKTHSKLENKIFFSPFSVPLFNSLKANMGSEESTKSNTHSSKNNSWYFHLDSTRKLN